MAQTKTYQTRTVMTLFLAMLSTMMVWAGHVTKEQARQHAADFLRNHTVFHRAPGIQPQLEAVREVSGLYVFNVSQKGGFVVVSNDDRTLPVLGYSDSGSIDPDNMPSNMRAWLQGYADEIAWLDQNNITTTYTARRVGEHPTTAIPELLKTTWDQGYPYNGYCPNDAVTGCVATAMAQVMNYHKWPTGTTVEIPAYGTLPKLGTTTFDWANMITNYSGSYTPTQAMAVAKLMQYCGWAVQMQYGGSSNARVSDVANALITYFGYKETTQYVNRSHYSYANWTDLIYHELEEGRPVVYGGQAIDNGHAFVCDGYKYDGGDLFHINWGWNGGGNGYFVLSVLNPSEQGIGGSASNSAYTFGQDAVIGIQKPAAEGTVLPVTPATVNLTLVSTSVPYAKIALGESIDVTVRVTNNSSDDYDGEIVLITNNSLGVGKMFEIPAGATQNCVINFTPGNVGDYVIGAARPNADGMYMGSANLGGTFTVVDQTPVAFTLASLSSTTANIGWTNVGGATKWNVRSKPVAVTTEDFNGSFTPWVTEKWSAKGGWAKSTNGGIDGTPCYASPSYAGGIDQDPDVGLITPWFELGGSVSFYVWGSHVNYEQFLIYIQQKGSANLVSITDICTAQTEPTLFTVDLSAYTGQGRIMIDHCYSGGHSQNSSLFVDDVTIIAPAGSWTTVTELTENSCNLTGLSAETFYQVQVQPVINGGGKWSDSYLFATAPSVIQLANDDSSIDTKNTDLIAKWNGATTSVQLKDRTLVGNEQWNTCCLPADFSVSFLKSAIPMLAPYDITARVLDKANTSLTDAGVLKLKFVDADVIPAGTPFIIKSNIPLATIPLYAFSIPNVTIDGSSDAIARMTQTSADGNVKFVGQWSSFDITNANIHEILYFGAENKIGYSQSPRTLKTLRAHLWVKAKEGSSAPAVNSIDIDFGDGDYTSITTANIDSADQQSPWYTLDGRRLQAAPTQKGIYIKNGKTIVIK